jgi:hypothetical protein
MLLAIFGALASFTLLLNMVATRRVLASDALTRNQKRNQLVFVWLVPVLGATTVLLIARELRAPIEREGMAGNHPEIAELHAATLGAASNGGNGES